MSKPVQLSTVTTSGTDLYGDIIHFHALIVLCEDGKLYRNDFINNWENTKYDNWEEIRGPWNEKEN